MAIYHLSLQIIGRSDGRSSTAAAAYRAGCRIVDFRTGEIHDFTRKRGVLESFILAPEAAPAWMHDRGALWNGVEKAEDELNRKRNTAQLAREMELSLPHELSHEQRKRLLKDFIEEEFVSRGMVADVAMHEPGREGDGRNFHAHVMFTMRLIDGDKFGEKERAWNQKQLLEHWRSSWERRLNFALETEGVEVRVDHRSYKRQALAAGHDVTLANLPTVHLGLQASGMERRGVATVPGDLNREVKVFNLGVERVRRAIEEEAGRSGEPAPAITPHESNVPNGKDQLRVQLQDVLGLASLPSAAEAGDAIRKRRDELLAIPSQRFSQSEAHTAASRRAHIAMKEIKSLGQHRDELQAHGRKLQAQANQNAAATQWRQAHPMRAWLHDMGVLTLPVAAIAGSQDELRRAWEQARKEDEQVRLRLEAAQRQQREASWLQEQLRTKTKQEATSEARELAAQLDQAELLVADLQRIEEAGQQAQKLEALPITRRPDTDRDDEPHRRPAP